MIFLAAKVILGLLYKIRGSSSLSAYVLLVSGTGYCVNSLHDLLSGSTYYRCFLRPFYQVFMVFWRVLLMVLSATVRPFFLWKIMAGDVVCEGGFE